jgi:L-lactate dehydrogenase complex protein LldF
VYHQTGGHAYGSVYQGPIGAIITPQLQSFEHSRTLPFASSLCGACYDVCPVKINIPEILIQLRAEIVRSERKLRMENLAMQAMALFFSNAGFMTAAENLAKVGQKFFTRSAALHGWTESRDLMPIPKKSFRDWWNHRDE